MSKHYMVGFYKSHGMEIYENVTCMNYRVLGLEDINGKQGCTFNVHRKMWKPNLGLGSTMGFGYSQLRCLPFAPGQYGKCDFRDNGRYDNVWFRNIVVYRRLFNDSYFSSLLSCCGCRLQGW